MSCFRPERRVLAVLLVMLGQLLSSAQAQTSDELRIRSFGKLPAFQIGVAGATDNLNLFLSPSCNYCQRMLLELVDAYKNGDSDFEDVATTVSLMPRKPQDVKIIAGLLCIDSRQRAASVIRYFRNINEITGGSAIKDAVATRAYEATLSQFGVSTTEAQACENSTTNLAIISDIYRIGDAKRSRDRMPVVMFNDEIINVDDFRMLTRSMR